MAGFDLGSILSEALSLQGTQTQQATQQAGLLQDAANLSNQQAGLIKEAGTLTAEAEMVKLTGELQTQKARVQAANAFGTNVGDVTDIITQLGQEMRATAIDLTKAQDRVTQIEAGSDLLTNPMGWLTDLLQGDAARAERDALASKFDTTQKLAQGLNSATQQTVQTQNAITETLSTASIQQATDAKKKLAEADALNATIQGKKYGADAIGVMRDMGAQNFNLSVRGYQLATEDARWKEGFALRQAQFEELQASRQLRKDQKAYYTEATDQINNYRIRIGLPPVTEQQVTQRLDRGDQLGQQMRDQQLSGWRMQEKGESGIFGDSPAETLSRIQRDNPQLPDSYAPAMSVYKDAAQLYEQKFALKAQDPMTGETFKKDKEAQARLFNETVAEYATTLQSKIDSKEGNPYKALPVSTILNENPELARTPFGTKVLATLSSTGQDDPTPEFLIASAVSAVQAGEISMNDARDGISKFFQQSNGILSSASGFLQLGLPVPTTYNVSMSKLVSATGGQSSSWGPLALHSEALRLISQGAPSEEERALRRDPVVDLSNPTDVTTVLSVAASKKRAETILKQAQEKN